MIEETEIWKDVLGRDGIYKGRYQISNKGRVRSIERRVNNSGGGTRLLPSKILKVRISPYGYPWVSFCVNGKSRPQYVHRLVADAFIPNPENKPYVDHINTIRTDYSIENLRWVTAKENANNPITKKRNDEVSHRPDALARALETKKGRNTKTCPKKIHQFTLEGEYVATYESSRDAMRKTGINSMDIREVNRGKRLSAGGFLWSETMTPHKYVRYKLKRKRVGQYDLNMNLIREWDSIGEAAKALCLWESNISRAIYGRTTKKCCGGFKWGFIEPHKR